MAVRGSTEDGSVRCDWRGVARTPQQREDAVRFWLDLDAGEALPSPTEVERRFMAELDRISLVYPETVRANFRAIALGGLSTDYLFLTCYVDYAVQEYLLGSGPSGTTPLSVSYDRQGEARSYDLYTRAHAMGEFGDEALMTEGEYEAYLSQLALDVETLLSILFEGRESIVFLAPMAAHNAIAVEAWQAVEQWDLQTDEDDVVQAVRYGVPASDPESTQTLANLKSRITAATTPPPATPDGNPSDWNEWAHDWACTLIEHTIAHEVGHPLGIGAEVTLYDHPRKDVLSIMSSGYEPGTPDYCAPQAYDKVALMALYQSR